MNNIILIGYMGCGKTTIGQTMSRLTGYAFTDTDALIEKAQGKSISDIFSQDGEPAFRGMETKLLEKMIAEKKDCMIIATGGGMPVAEENRALLKKLGAVVYLKVSPKTVFKRVKSDSSRPLLQCENPLNRINEMLLQRSPYYEEAADFIIDADYLFPDEAAKEIIKIVNSRKD